MTSSRGLTYVGLSGVNRAVVRHPGPSTLAEEVSALPGLNRKTWVRRGAQCSPQQGADCNKPHRS